MDIDDGGGKMKSEQIDMLVKSLIKAQSEIKPVVKSKVNPIFNSKYADLATIDEAVKSALHANGLCVVQTTEMAGTTPVLETTLMHESGQWVSGQYPLLPVEQDPQALAATVTYARRIALSAILGVVADDDTDGNQTMERSVAAKTATARENGAEAEEIHAITFIPKVISERSGETNGKPWTQFGIKGNGEWFSTFDERIAENAKNAKENRVNLEIRYKVNGKYKNILSAALTVPF
jgi:hypothetical protein